MLLRDKLLEEAVQAVDARIAEFWAQVDKNGPIPKNLSTPCWLWVGNTKSKGYGQFWIGGKQEYVHRISWMLLRGELESGEQVLHHCDTPACLNAALGDESHLFLGTHLDNMQDRDNKGRRVALVGSQHGGAKLSEEAVRDIKRLLLVGVDQGKIAKQFSVSRGLISRINTGKNWRHVCS